MRVRESVEELSGAERTAILLFALGEQHAAKLFSLMSEDEIRDLSQTMANLGRVSASVVEALFVDFAGQISNTGALVGTFESTERLLAKVLDSNQVKSIMEDIRGPAGRTMWDKLGNVNEIVLANYLRNEYPQTVAVILSKVRSDHAARVLTHLPETFAMDVVMRMLHMDTVQKHILDDVEQTLRNEFFSNLARTQRRDAHELMAEIFNNFDRSTEQRFLAALEERDSDSAARIKGLMFTFEDLVRIDGQGMQVLLRNIDKAKLPLALKGAPEPVRELFFKNMSERAARLLRDDLQALGPVRLREVEDAQSEIVQMAKDLAAKGEIYITSNKDDELVY